MPRMTIYPKTHYVTPRQSMLDAIDKIKDELRERLAQLHAARTNSVEAQRLEQRARFDMEMIVELGYCTWHRKLFALSVGAAAR